MTEKMNKMTKISVVSPVYRGEKMVSELVRRNVEALTGMGVDYEIILVNDASPDNSWQAIEAECKKNPKVKGLNLSKNFGQHYAITAGLNYVSGDWVVIMDCDLQDRPEEIPNLYAKAKEGYDVVFTKAKVKRVGWWKRFSSVAFYKMFNWLSGSNSDNTVTHFGIYRKCVIDEVCRMPEQARSIKFLVEYVGYKQSVIETEKDERFEGTSSYNLRRLLKLSFDIIISNTNKPLRIAVGLGIGMSILSFLLAAYNIIARLVGIIGVDGFTTTVFSIWFVGGLLLFVMGVLGLYIGKIFDQVKGRQLYIVSDKVNL